MNSGDTVQFFARRAALNISCVKVMFKKRKSIFGLFPKSVDYLYLKSKNFRHIVPQNRPEAYKTSKDATLARIFNGGEFLRLAI